MSSNKNEANEAKSSDTADDGQIMANMLALNEPKLDSMDESVSESPFDVDMIPDQPVLQLDISGQTLDTKLTSHHDRIIMEIDKKVAARLLQAQQAITLLLESVPDDPATRDERTSLMACIDKLETSISLLDKHVDGVTKTLEGVHDCNAAVLATLAPVRSAVLVLPPMQQSVSSLVTHVDHVTDILQPAVDTVLPEIRATVNALTQKFDSLVNNTDSRLAALSRSSDYCDAHASRHDAMGPPPVDADSVPLDGDADDDSYMSSYHGLERQGYKTPGPGSSSRYASAAHVTPIPLSPYGTPYLSKRGASASSSRYPPLVPLSSPGRLVSKQNGSARSLHEHASGGLVNWLENPKGPYLGGVAKTFKTFSVSLTGDGFDDFFCFYNACVSQLDIVGYHRRLLLSLDDVAPDVDLTRSPIRATCMPVAGDHAHLTWARQGYWDQQHANLSQLLYLTLTSKDVIKPSAPLTLSIVHQHSQHSNGFGVLQGLLCRHHPRVSLSTAPQFANVLTLCLPSFYDDCVMYPPSNVIGYASSSAKINLTTPSTPPYPSFVSKSLGETSIRQLAHTCNILDDAFVELYDIEIAISKLQLRPGNTRDALARDARQAKLTLLSQHIYAQLEPLLVCLVLKCQEYIAVLEINPTAPYLLPLDIQIVGSLNDLHQLVSSAPSPTCVGLSPHCMTDLLSRLSELSSLYYRNRDALNRVMDKLVGLWTTLAIPMAEQHAHLIDIGDCVGARTLIKVNRVFKSYKVLAQKRHSVLMADAQMVLPLP